MFRKSRPNKTHKQGMSKGNTLKTRRRGSKVAILNTVAAQKGVNAFHDKKKRELPEDVLRIVREYSRPVQLNVYDRRPALKIMETEDVYKWIDYVFGFEEGYGAGGWQSVVNRIEQKGEYQIIHLNNLLNTAYVDYLDDFYVSLDKFGALWIERTTEARYKRRENRERQPTEGGIEYYTEPHEGCWQIQYADPKTPKRIVQCHESQVKYFKRRYPDAVKMNFMLYGERETGFIPDKKPRPKVKLTPFLPRISNESTNSEAELTESEEE